MNSNYPRRLALKSCLAAGRPGKSAYEIAVQEGFDGTEEEWLASLVGPQGPSGRSGRIWYTEVAPIGGPGQGEFFYDDLDGADNVVYPERGDVICYDGCLYWVDRMIVDLLGNDVVLTTKEQSIVGPQGETGAQGPQGPQGPQGIQGEKGDTGSIGSWTDVECKSVTIDSYTQSSEPQYGAVKIETADVGYGQMSELRLTQDEHASDKGVIIAGVADPVTEHDAANKNYVDARTSGLCVVWTSESTVQQGINNYYLAVADLVGPEWATPAVGHILMAPYNGVLHGWLIIEVNLDTVAVVAQIA